MATLYKTNGAKIYVAPKNKKKFTLRELQDLVGGFVSQFKAGSGHVLVVNEDGRLLDLQHNRKASELVKQFGYVPIVGDAVYCTEEEAL